MVWLIGASYLLAALGFYVWMVKRAVLHDEIAEVQVETEEQKKQREEKKRVEEYKEDELEEEKKAA